MPRRATLIVLVLLAGFWAGLLWQAADSIFSRAPLLDELYYLDRAAEIHAGQWPGDRPFFMTPLYPLLVAASGAGRGLAEPGILPTGDLLGIRLVQAVCWLGVFLLLARIARRSFAALLPAGWRRETAAWAPALLFALYRPAAIFSLGVLLEVPLLLLLTVALERMLAGGPTVRRALIAGVALGLAALLRGTALLVVPVAAWALLHGAAGRGARARTFAALVLPVLILLAPPTIHNSRLAGRAVGPTLNAGLNLYIGNGAQANGFYRTLWEGDWRRDPAGLEHLAEQAGRDDLGLADADAIWLDRARKATATDPLGRAVLFAKKIRLHFVGWEIDQLVPLTAWTGEAPLLRVQWLPWRVLVVLGLAGLGVLFGKSGADRRTIAILAGVLAMLVLGQSLFFVVSRYRLALVPVLCLLAGAGLARSLAPDTTGRRLVGPLVLGLIALVLSQPWESAGRQERWRVLAQVNTGHRWAILGEAEQSESALARAEDLFRSVLTADVTRPDWWLALALVQKDRGDLAEAEATLVEGDELHPGDLDLQTELLGLLLQQDRREEALTRAETVLADHPEDADTLHNYTILLARSGRAAEARETAESLVRTHPRDARGYVDLGILYAQAGEREEARRIFERGLAVVPGSTALQRNLAVLDR